MYFSAVKMSEPVCILYMKDTKLDLQIKNIFGVRYSNYNQLKREKERMSIKAGNITKLFSVLNLV